MPDSLTVEELNQLIAIPPSERKNVPGWAYSYLYDVPNMLGNLGANPIAQAPISESFFIYSPVDTKKTPPNLDWHDHYDPLEIGHDEYDPIVHQNISYIPAISSGFGHLGNIALRSLPVPLLKLLAEEMKDPATKALIKNALSKPDPRSCVIALIRQQIFEEESGITSNVFSILRSKVRRAYGVEEGIGSIFNRKKKKKKKKRQAAALAAQQAAAAAEKETPPAPLSTVPAATDAIQSVKIEAPQQVYQPPQQVYQQPVYQQPVYQQPVLPQPQSSVEQAPVVIAEEPKEAGIDLTKLLVPIGIAAAAAFAIFHK